VVRKAAKDFGFRSIEMILAGCRYEFVETAGTDRFWNVCIPISDLDHVTLTGAFETPVQTAAVAPFADVLRRALVPKLTGFARQDDTSPRMIAAAMATENSYYATVSGRSV
jgi:hypothetical protein